MEGKLLKILEQKVPVQEGTNSYSYLLDGIPRGEYLLLVKTPKDLATLKFLKQ